MTGALVVMAKRPAPGATKTRLTPALSAEQAAALYECFLRDALDSARAVPGVMRTIAYPPGDGPGYFKHLAGDFELVRQAGATLGQRLASVLDAYLGRGWRPGVAMSSDSPTLPVDHVRRAFSWLAEDSREGLRVGLLPAWYDVDTAEDLVRLRADLTALAPAVARHTRGRLGSDQTPTG